MLCNAEVLHQGAAQIHGHFSGSSLLGFWLSFLDPNSSKRFRQQFRIGWRRIARKARKTLAHRLLPSFRWYMEKFQDTEDSATCLALQLGKLQASIAHVTLSSSFSCARKTDTAAYSPELEKWHIMWQKLGQRISLPHVQWVSDWKQCILKYPGKLQGDKYGSGWGEDINKMVRIWILAHMIFHTFLTFIFITHQI